MISGNTIMAPIGVSSTANFFGTSTDVASVCQAIAINKWAKYKPIALTSMGLTDTPASLSIAQRANANYGLVYKSAYASNRANLITAVQSVCSSSGLWTYTKPVTGTDYMRLDDFVRTASDSPTSKPGYLHTSDPLCEEVPISAGYSITETSNLPVSFCNGQGADSKGQLIMSDLGIYQNTLAGCYLGIAFKDTSSSGAEWYYSFSESPLNSVTWDNDLPQLEIPIITNPVQEPFKSISQTSTKTYTGYVFIINLSSTTPSSIVGKPIAQSSLPNVSYTVYSLPCNNVATGTFTVTSPLQTITYSNLGVTVGTSGITIKIEAKNTTKSQQKIQKLFVWVYTDTAEFLSGIDINGTLTDLWLTSGDSYQPANYYDDDGVLTAAEGAASVGTGIISSGGTLTYECYVPYLKDGWGGSYASTNTINILICAQDSAHDGNSGKSVS